MTQRSDDDLHSNLIYEQGPQSWGPYVPDLPEVIAVPVSIHEAGSFHSNGLAVPACASSAGQ